MQTLLDILYGQSHRKQAAVFLYENFFKVKSLTYADLIDGGSVVAQELKNRGYEGLPIPIVARTDADFIFGFFGILMSGNIPVPVAPSEFISKAEYIPRIQGIMKTLGAPVILGKDGLLKSLKINTLCVKHQNSGNSKILNFKPSPKINGSSLCLIQFSSGSTQDPRGVELSHEQVLANLKQIAQGMKVTQKDILASWLPLYHDMGLIGGLLAALYNGVPLHLSGPADFVAAPARWLQFVGEVRATIIMGPDFSYRMYVKKTSPAQRAVMDLSRVRLALSGAEPVSAQTCRQFYETFKDAGLRPSALFPVYGLAENTLGVTFPIVGQKHRVEKLGQENLLRGLAECPVADERAVEVVSCGKPLDGIQVMIQSQTDNEAMDEKRVGRILIKSPSSTRGYHKNARATEDLFYNGWLVTGDLGFIWNGELFVVGREKDLIKINGKNYYSSDLERKAAELGGFRVGRVAAFSAIDLDEDREIVRIAVETQELFPNRRKKMKSQLARILSEIILVDQKNIHLLPPCSIPRTSSGKTKRFELRSMWQQGLLTKAEKKFSLLLFAHRLRILSLSVRYAFRALAVASKQFVAGLRPRKKTTLKDRVAGRLSQVLAEIAGLDPKMIQPRKSFRDYKIDSLGLVTLTCKLNEEVAEIPLTTFIEHNTIEDLSAFLLSRYPQEARQWVEKGRRD